MGLVDAWPTPRRLEGHHMTLSRWKTALHESAHLRGAVELLDEDHVGAAILNDTCGLALVGIPSPPITSHQAICVMAGRLAEGLAEEHPPPGLDTGTEARDLPIPQGDLREALTADHRMAMPDDVCIARWCIANAEGEPEKWGRRYDWLAYQTKLFVADAAPEILEIANRLYLCGVVVMRGMARRHEQSETFGHGIDNDNQTQAT